VKVKFNLFERVAGLFVLIAIGSSLAVTIGMGIKKGWFDPKIYLKTFVTSAEGIHAGTPVSFSGLRIGSVDSVDLKSAGEVEIHFKILKKFQNQIHSKSIVRVIRPFIIGEKALEIDASADGGVPIVEGQTLTAQNAPDFLEFLGGNKLGSYMESLSMTMQNMQKLAEAFLSDERSDKIIELFDQLFPLMEKMNSMAGEVSILSASLNDKKRLARVVEDFLKITTQMNKALPAAVETMPELTANILQLTKNMNQLTSDMKVIIPVIKEIAPDMPSTTKKLMTTLDETVLTFRAMQKTWMLNSNVKEVIAEEKKKEERKPASQD
jgi:phospholipid/cholesterol/gamma-HCH transport system substrate-binding protein